MVKGAPINHCEVLTQADDGRDRNAGALERGRDSGLTGHVVRGRRLPGYRESPEDPPVDTVAETPAAGQGGGLQAAGQWRQGR